MIGKNYAYNGLDMSDTNVWANKISLQNVDISTTKRQRITNNANDHGSRSSRTLQSGRLFVFDGKIVGMTKEERGIAWNLLNNHIYVEPFMNTPYLHDLTFKNDVGYDRVCKCMVKEDPKWSNSLHHPDINFTFELYAPSNAVYHPVEQNASGSSSFFGGTSFPNNFGDSWGSFAGGASCFNEGNYKAECVIEVTGNLTNPLIKNITNGIQYKINGQTTNLVLDSRDGWSVTDNGVNISSKREYGEAVLLSPWSNTIGVFADSGDATFTVRWNSTWDFI